MSGRLVAESNCAKVVKGRNDVKHMAALLNLLSPSTRPLRDMRVRKALNYAVNKEELRRYAFKGNALKMRGVLTEKSGVDLSETKSYEWNIPKARELLEDAGYGRGFKIKILHHEKDFLTAQFLQRFYSLLNVDVELNAVQWESLVEHAVYPNTRPGHSWEEEDWWIVLFSDPGYVPEGMGGWLEWIFRSGAPWRAFPDWIGEPLEEMYQEVLRTQDRAERFALYKKANEYVADQALVLSTMAPLNLYGVNMELDYVPHPSQYLYLDYSSVTDRHWSVRGK